jgi:hypothetical protein
MAQPLKDLFVELIAEHGYDAVILALEAAAMENTMEVVVNTGCREPFLDDDMAQWLLVKGLKVSDRVYKPNQNYEARTIRHDQRVVDFVHRHHDKFPHLDFRNIPNGATYRIDESEGKEVVICDGYSHKEWFSKKDWIG